jgi:hypothetical protein
MHTELVFIVFWAVMILWHVLFTGTVLQSKTTNCGQIFLVVLCQLYGAMSQRNVHESLQNFLQKTCVEETTQKT